MASEFEKLRLAKESLDTQLESFEKQITEMREANQSKFKELLDKHQATEIYPEYLEDFLKEPYVMIPKKAHEWYVIVPKFVKMAVGWCEHSTKSFNIFVVNKYQQWTHDIPSVIQDKLKFPEALPFKVYDGMLLTGDKLQDKAFQKYRKFVQQRMGKDRIKVKKGWEFKLIAQLIEDGILPFVPKPLAETDLKNWSGVGYEKYRSILKEKNIKAIQQKAWNEFLDKGALGIFWAFGSGKSIFGHRIIGNVKGPHLVIVPTVTLKEQWKERLNIFNPKTKYEVEVQTYHAYEKVRKQEWKVVIFDECQHLPARTFIRLSTIRAKYRIGFSGSPFREDGRENYIFALTGFPIGMSWEDLLRLKIVEAPQFRVYIVADKRAKDLKLEELLRIPVKTIIFCDSLDYGEQISRKFEIPFVYGATKDRLDIIRQSDTCVVSRVGDEGISISNLERIIEVAFLFGSRMQESQRFGRLMHSTKKAQHIVIMTEKEFESYGKRLNAILQRGFKIEYVR